jgi:hypothetical protein
MLFILCFDYIAVPNSKKANHELLVDIVAKTEIPYYD